MIIPYDSPVGRLRIHSDGGFITTCAFTAGTNDGMAAAAEALSTLVLDPVLQQCVAELDAYFSGKLRQFTVPTKPAGTDFQREVWEALAHIPYGETTSYGEIAARIGRPKAVRAVGGANHRNPIVIIIPCHRVIGMNGKLTGYGGGLPQKAFLLAHERQYSAK